MTDIKPSFVVKVCGITTREDAAAAIEAGTNALGFNFWPESPRFITARQAKAICDAVPGDYLRVGVFVDANLEMLMTAAEAVGLHVLQLHGNSAVPEGFGFRIWRAIRGENAVVAPDSRIEAYLLDATTPNHGGSGKTFEWKTAKNFKQRAIVAGGLNASNVADAIDALHPWGVDACSQIEAEPGRKDHARMRAFIEAALAAKTVRV